MATNQPIIPDILTEKNWQKNKGLFATMQGKTGIGELMKKLASAYDDINWALFDPDSIKLNDRNTPTKLQRLGDLADKEFTNKVSLVRKAAESLSQEARAVAEKWKKTSTIPSASRRHVEGIDIAAQNLAASLRNFKSWQGAYDSLLERVEHAQEFAFARLVAANNAKNHSTEALESLTREIMEFALKEKDNVRHDGKRVAAEMSALIKRADVLFKNKPRGDYKIIESVQPYLDSPEVDRVCEDYKRFSRNDSAAASLKAVIVMMRNTFDQQLKSTK